MVQVAFILLAAATANAGAADVRFNLICEGQQASLRNAADVKGWSNEFRIDLEKMSWCATSCDKVYELAEVTEAEIKISKGMTISRVTGDVTSITNSPWLPPTKINGKCRRAPFGGFPEKLF